MDDSESDDKETEENKQENNNKENKSEYKNKIDNVYITKGPQVDRNNKENQNTEDDERIISYRRARK